ncbi:MAG: hypothetical protein ACK4Y4_10230, partial [Brevundimonas sp.]
MVTTKALNPRPGCGGADEAEAGADILEVEFGGGGGTDIGDDGDGGEWAVGAASCRVGAGDLAHDEAFEQGVAGEAVG